jgi:multisubunit Na+/H+ antiporter MnhE subunit
MAQGMSVRTFVITCIVLWASWLVLSDNTGWREMAVGAIASVATTVSVARFISVADVHFRIRGQYLKEAIHLPVLQAKGLWTLLAAMARQVGGAGVRSGVVAVRFRAGGDDPTSRARRAIAITYLNLTPDSVVLGVLKEKGILLFHAIGPERIPPFMERMGAEPGQQP